MVTKIKMQTYMFYNIILSSVKTSLKILITVILHVELIGGKD